MGLPTMQPDRGGLRLVNGPDGATPMTGELPVAALTAAKNAISHCLQMGDRSAQLQLQGVNVLASQMLFANIAQTFATIAIAEALEQLVAKP